MNLSLKKCCRCKENKSINEFGKDKHCKDGLSWECKQCRKELYSKWYKSKGIEYHKRWRKINKEKLNSRSLEYYHRNKESIREKLNKKYKIDNDFRLMHLRSKNNWEKNNPEKIKLQKKRHYEKLKLNPLQRVSMNIRNGIYKSLKRNKNGYHWEDLVGYKLENLKKHLEKQFINGMNWDNYGLWHIDHIIPVSAFNFQKHNNIDFKKCWNLKNLQPLWKKDNLEKLGKLNKPFQPSLAI